VYWGLRGQVLKNPVRKGYVGVFLARGKGDLWVLEKKKKPLVRPGVKGGAPPDG